MIDRIFHNAEVLNLTDGAGTGRRALRNGMG